MIAKPISIQQILSAVILAWQILLPVASTRGQELEVSGTLKAVSIRMADGTPRDPVFREFKLSRTNSDVYIMLSAAPGEEVYVEFFANAKESFLKETFTTGTNSHRSTNYTRSARTGRMNPPKNDSTVICRPTPLPPPTSGLDITSIWLAFAGNSFLPNLDLESLSYLGAMTNPRLIKMINRLRFRATYTSDPSPPNCVSAFVQFQEGGVLDDNGTLRPLPRELNAGATNAAYSVTSWTNVDGLHLPKAFTYSLYRASEAGTSEGASRLLAVYSGEVKSITRTPSVTSFTPTIIGPTRVLEYRYENELRSEAQISTPAVYVTTAGKLRSLEESIASSYRNAKKVSMQAQTAQRIRKVTYIALAALCILPMIYFARRSLRGNKTTP